MEWKTLWTSADGKWQIDAEIDGGAFELLYRNPHYDPALEGIDPDAADRLQSDMYWLVVKGDGEGCWMRGAKNPPKIPARVMTAWKKLDLVGYE